jgi:glycosyltransferase involved in cell wall biosynthesis
VEPKSIAWFLPAFNEAENLPIVIPDIYGYLSSLAKTFTITIVNDGSKDNTSLVAEKLAREYPQVFVVHHKINQGYGAAVRSGLQASLATRHELIGYCDADNQFRIQSLEPMLDKIEMAGAVIGYRLRRADGLKRLVMGRGWTSLSRIALGYDARDIDCGFKLFRREVVAAVLPQITGRYAAISPELITRIQLAGFAVIEVGVEHYPRTLGSQTGDNLREIFGSFLDLYHLRREIKREMETNVANRS